MVRVHVMMDLAVKDVILRNALVRHHVAAAVFVIARMVLVHVNKGLPDLHVN